MTMPKDMGDSNAVECSIGIQRSAKRYANLAKQDPGRLRQNR